MNRRFEGFFCSSYADLFWLNFTVSHFYTNPTQFCCHTNYFLYPKTLGAELPLLHLWCMRQYLAFITGRKLKTPMMTLTTWSPCLMTCWTLGSNKILCSITTHFVYMPVSTTPRNVWIKLFMIELKILRKEKVVKCLSLMQFIDWILPPTHQHTGKMLKELLGEILILFLFYGNTCQKNSMECYVWLIGPKCTHSIL